MDAHGIYVFHAADSKSVTKIVADDFDLYLMPSLKISLDKGLADRRSSKRILYPDHKILYVSYHRISGPSECEIRTKYERKRSQYRKFLSPCHGGYPPAGDDRLFCIDHGLPERFPSFGPFNSLRLCAKHFAAVLLPRPSLFALHA